MDRLVRMAMPERLHQRLLAAQLALQAEKGRRVTLHETVEILLDRAGEREDQGA